MSAEPFAGVDHIDTGLNALEIEFGTQSRERIQLTAHVLREKKLTEAEMRKAIVVLIEKGVKGKFPRTSDILVAARPPGVNLQPERAPEPFVPRLDTSKFDPEDGNTILGYFRVKGTALDDLAYTPRDLAHWPNRASLAARWNDPSYLARYGDRALSPQELAQRHRPGQQTLDPLSYVGEERKRGSDQ